MSSASSTTRTGPTADLAAADLAAELGLPPGDAPILPSVTRVPVAWLADWRSRTGPRDLRPADVALLLGCSTDSVYRYLRAASGPRLRCREGAGGSRRNPRVAPADFANFLRARNAAHGVTPVLTETPGQLEKRKRTGRERFFRAVRGE